jgi:septum formation protein
VAESVATGRPLYLASQSPRRAELLDQIAVPFAPLDVTVDEAHRPGEGPEAYVARVAREKAEAGAARLTGSGVVLGADTAIELGGRILGKPADETEARSWLTALSGRDHHVLSAVALADGGRTDCRVNRTRVRMRPIAPEEIQAYLATGEPADKAGGYAIQGRGALFVEQIEGSYSAVMGLPLCETGQLLGEFGVRVL